MGPMLLCFVLVFAAVLLAPVVHRLAGKASPWVLAAVPLAAFVVLFQQLPLVQQGSAITEAYPWVPQLGFSLAFLLDGLSMLFALLITGIGALIVIYGGTYLAKDKHLPRFYSFLFLFMGAMLGVVLSDNIFALFVFWELTSLSSFLLIGYKHGYEDSRKSALQALLVTGMGGLALLGGLLLASVASGTPLISEWVAGNGTFADSKHFALMLALILAGAFTKSAQFPFHFWLPNAMAAPTPVSAYLHSATMVKAGVYLLARLNPHFADTLVWGNLLVLFGGTTMLLGAVWALWQYDLKKILAYTTISALGLLVCSIGIGSPLAIQGAMVFLLAHAFYKGGLFMVAGNAGHATGTYDVDRLYGLASRMPVNGLAVLLTALSMAGFPLMLGFLGKELLYEAALNAPQMRGMLTVALFATSVIFVALAVLLAWKVFHYRKIRLPEKDVREVPAGMYLGPLLLGVLGLAAGTVPGTTVQALLGQAAVAISPAAEGLKLYLWHGITPVLGLSVLTLLAGVLLYRFTRTFRHWKQGVERLERIGPEAVYERGWVLLLAFGVRLTAILQNGHLRFYIMTIIGTLVLLAWLAVWQYGLFTLDFTLIGANLFEILLAALVAVAILFTMMAGSRLAAIAILGVVGYGVAVFYAIYGAADLAMTQFLVETLTLVVFVYVLYRLPGYMKLSPGLIRFRDIMIATAGGVTMTFIILLATNYPMVSELKQYFAENSYVLAKGRNVVNVILVDFRALDTLGEIIVLSIAALGVMALVRLKMSRDDVHSGNKTDAL